jgi:tRNA G10  N-methylase Trm11
MLFPVPGCGSLPEDPKEAGKQLAKTALLPFLKSCHKGEGTFYFRVELRGKMDLDQKAAFTKKFAKTLEQASGRELLNSTSVYEVEIRLLHKKDGTFVPLLKLFTLKDKRFAYRKQTLAASIQPVNAALMMQLLKPWLKEGAQVIDPFCGVGTMLIERAKVMEAKPLYGIDIYGEAIEKARINTEEAGLTINYINRDFLDFKHSYLFDELITNMPTVTKAKSVEEITQLYERSLEQTRWVVKKDGILALYTTEETILRHCLKNCDFLEPEKKWVIREKEGSVLYLLRMR